MRQLTISHSITYRETHSIERYLRDIGKIDLLSPEEEVELSRRIKRGDELALQQLVNSNLRFVVSVAKQYPNSYLSLNDLINYGNLGLINAAKRFDETRGFKFISYAVWWIRQSIIQAIAEQSRLIRLPLNQLTAIHKLNRKAAEMEQKFEREPTNEELSSELDLTDQQIANAVESSSRHISLDAPVQEGEYTQFYELIVDDEMERTDHHLSHHTSLSIDLEEVLSSLSARERQILENYYGIGKKEPQRLETIANSMGLTRERIRQIKDKAILRLRLGGKCSHLLNYLDR